MTDWVPGDPINDPWGNTRQAIIQLKHDRFDQMGADAARWHPKFGWISPYTAQDFNG